MAESTSYKQFNRFLVAVLVVTLLAGLLKIGLTVLCEIYVYSIPILGGLLQSLELVELTNFVAFSILGFGIGSATAMLPGRVRLRLGAIALTILTPIILSTSYATRYHMWVGNVASQADIPRAEARQLANTFLDSKTGWSGSLGFYLYTVEIPILPLSTAEMEDISATQSRFQSDLTEASGLESNSIKLLFSIVGWGIRGFYLFIALMSVAIYFYRGMGRAQTVRQQRRQAPPTYQRT